MDRPADEVFAYATDPARFSEWQKGVVNSHTDRPAGSAVGDRCVTVRRIGLADRAVTSEITRVDPPRTWRVRGIDGPIQAIVDVAVEPLARQVYEVGGEQGTVARRVHGAGARAGRAGGKRRGPALRLAADVGAWEDGDGMIAVEDMRALLVVAEERNFTRAAERLVMTQPALSRRVRRAEERLGVRLFERSTHDVSLTQAGQVLLDQAPAVLAAVERLGDEVVRAGRAEAAPLRLGWVHGAALEMTPLLVERFAERHPEVELVVREFGWDRPDAGLGRDGTDVAILRLPVTGVEKLRVVPLFAEPVVLAVATGDPVAARTSVPVGQLLDLPLTGGAAQADPVSSAYWLARAVRPAPAPVVATRSPGEDLALVAAGRARTISSPGAMRRWPREGVTFVALEDVAASVVAVAARRDAPAVAEAFMRHARRTAASKAVEHLRDAFGWELPHAHSRVT